MSSLFLNCVLILRIPEDKTDGLSEFVIADPAKIKRDTVVGFTHESDFTSKDRKIQNAAWQSPELNPELGLVALPETFASSKDLPTSQLWPWDLSKRIYLINGFHSMHCVHALRVTIHQFFDGKVPTLPESHVIHCIDVMREEIMCSADDTPRYTGRVNTEVGKKIATSGNGQTRMCKNWSALAKWATDNSACYRYVNKTDPDFPELERYKYCPDGRVFWPE
ncbi:Thioesterase domain-containing protein [Rutstroemia sp. NJR-2017a BBW]|nr:Thioesterase domain-containing protein [Rutstroemia sp. NJR-2017a BBW]